jgi:hypothetical protein
MKKIRVLVFVVGIVQIILGLAFLLAPHGILRWMGHSPIANDISYPLGMLSSRFLVYGALMLIAAKNPGENRLLIMGMVWIQIIDLAVGMFYTLQSTVALSLSAFPMFNATVIALLLWLWRPAQKQTKGVPSILKLRDTNSTCVI